MEGSSSARPHRWLPLPNAPFWDVGRALWVSTFAGNFLPGGTGNEVVRWHMMALTVGHSRSAVSIIIERAVTLSRLLLCATAGLALLRPDLLWVVPTVGLLLGVAAVVGRHWLPDPDTLAVVTGISMLRLGLQCALIWLALVACGADVGLSAVLLAGPVVILAVLLPISVGGGAGVREATMTVAFAPFGIEPATAVMAGFLITLCGFLSTLPGAALLMAGRRRHA